MKIYFDFYAGHQSGIHFRQNNLITFPKQKITTGMFLAR